MSLTGSGGLVVEALAPLVVIGRRRPLGVLPLPHLMEEGCRMEGKEGQRWSLGGVRSPGC